MLQSAIDKTVPKPEEIVIDWKGISGHKDTVKALLENISLPIRKI
jgi:hypothetical protein